MSALRFPLAPILRGALLLLFVTPAFAQSPPSSPASPVRTGRITGRVLDTDHQPIPYADVRIHSLRRGTLTDERGVFTIDQLPPGEYEVVGAPIGHTPQALRVHVAAGASATARFSEFGRRMVILPDLIVRPNERIDTQRSDTRYKLPREKFDALPVEQIADVIATQPGVVVQAGEIHLQGSRGNEVKSHVNGVEANNPLTGENPDLALMSLNGIELISGGFDAEYGNALAGIINLTTREGAQKFGGELRWDTDRFGDPTKTFNDYDRLTFGFGGPTPIANLTWFGTYEGAFSNTYLKSTLTRPSHTLFDFLQFGNRQNNRMNTNLKLAWNPNAGRKLTFETANNRSIVTPYNHMWSRRGFVKVTQDTNRTTGAITPRYGTWSFQKEDDSFVPMNMPDHVPTTEDRFRSLAAAWTQTLSAVSAFTLRVSTFGFDERTSVGRKAPWEYDVASPNYWTGNTTPGSENNPYFATHGDLPFYTLNAGSTESIQGDYSTKVTKNHNLKIGVEARHHRVRNLALLGPNLESGGLPGQVRSDFENDYPEAYLYAQDRWTYEGLVLNAGARWDLYSPGQQVADADLRSGRRWKQQWSPRLGIAYPISDKDVLSFHYGWFYQAPASAAVFENRQPGTSVGTRGNPDLEPETNIAYQAGMQHLFSRDVSGSFTVFFKDIYGLIRARQMRDEFGNLVNVWTNGDYASARGFETALSKRFSHKFSADVGYSYQIATGVASDPASAVQFFNGGGLYLPISEQPLNWDQRQTLNVSAVVRDPGKWGFRMLWSYGSGLPYTPTFRNDRKPDPVYTNSRTLPSSSRLTIDGDKYFRIWSRDVTVFFEARNVLDARTIGTLDQSSFPNPNLDRSGQSDYLAYYTETGRAGGAYLQDVNGDFADDWVPVRDPRVFEEGRSVRLGLKLTF